MRPRRHLRLLFAAIALLVPLLSASAKDSAARPSPSDAIASLPESNPYREALLRLDALSPEDRKLLGGWISPPSDTPASELPASLRAFASELADTVRAAAGRPRTTAADWPLTPNPAEPDNPAASLTFLRYGATRELAYIASRHADTLPPSEAIEFYAATAQLARQQRSAGTLIEQLTGVAIEGVAHAAVSRRLGEFSAPDLQRLSAAWASLLPRPTNAEAVAGEREIFFLPLAQNVLLPGLRELLADPDAGASSAEASPDLGFTRDLRLSGLMNLGDGEQRIVLENTRSGEHLTLVPGRVVEGIEFVSLDFDRRLAVIRRGSQEAVIHLQSKRIVERKSPAVVLREQLAGLDVVSGQGSGDETLARLLERVRLHPDGPEGYVRDYIAAFDRGIAHQLELADQANAPKTDEESKPDDPLLALMLPPVGRLGRTLNNSATASTVLQAAINHRLGDLQQGIDPFAHPDPWASTSEPTPFSYERTPDGGFLLRSVYETALGQPLTYKFAAPDAGFIRQSSSQQP